MALKAAVARLQPEVNGKPLAFAPDVLPARANVQGEAESHEARLRCVDEAMASTGRSVRLLQRELARLGGVVAPTAPASPC